MLHGVTIGDGSVRRRRHSSPTPVSDRTAGPRGLPLPRSCGVNLAVALVAGTILAWALASLALPELRLAFAWSVPWRVSFEVAGAVARFFAAFALLLVPGEPGRRLAWVAAALILQATAGLLVGAALPLFGVAVAPATECALLLFVWTGVGLLLAFGLGARASGRMVSAAAGAALALGAHAALPTLAGAGLLGPAPGTAFFSGDSTASHALATAVPLGLTLAAFAAARRAELSATFRPWLLLGLVALAGAQLHHAIRPSAYGQLLTGADLLRLAFSLLLAAGAVVALRAAAAADRGRILAATRRAERLNQLIAVRTDLTAVVAHELAGPVAAIRNLAQVLALPDLSPDDRQGVLDALRTEADLLGVLVGDVRTIGSLDHVGLALTPIPVEIGVLLGDAVGLARALPGNHPVAWPQTAAGRVLADPERIAQVLRNLLANAAKYTPPGTPIRLQVARAGDRLRIEVIDHGPGIDPADVERIFEKFGRGRRHDPSIPGSGLGLYLSRAIVRAHGGELRVGPTPGGGATFAFDLPLAR